MRNVSKLLGLLTLAIPLLGIAGVVHRAPSGGTEVEIVPSEVVVGPHQTDQSTFELEARLWTGPPTDRRTAIDGQDYNSNNLQWTEDQSWLTKTSQDSLRAKFRVDANVGPGKVATVTLKAGSKTAEARISTPTDEAQDEVRARYVGNQPPGAVVVNGVPEGSAAEDCAVTLLAFVRRSKLGKVASPCTGNHDGWEAAVLSVDHQLVFASGWTPAENSIDARPQQGALQSLPVALRVMVGGDDLDEVELADLRDTVLKVAEAEIEAAISIFMEARAGIELTKRDPQQISITEAVAIGDCKTGDDLTSTYDGDFDDEKVVHVYYVNNLYSFRGRACPAHDDRPWDVIYVSWDNHSASTLIHELGHALGLTLPGQGHSDVLAGFDPSNVMTSGDNDLDPGGRRRLSVGQVFRMNADEASWLNHAVKADGTPLRDATSPRLECQCGANDPPGRCPPLVADVAKPSGAGQTAKPWQCSDQLRLAKVSDADNEDPVAIVAGRSWRAPPGTCRTDLPAHMEKHWNATYVKFDNLTNPGDCPSWAAIFFRYHAPIHFPLPAGALTQAADQWPVNNPKPPAVPFDVYLYYPPAELNKVNQDTAHALETLGPSNRTGLSLTFHRNTTDPCPTASPGSLEITLCYTTGGNAEAILTPPRLIKISRVNRRGTTASHFLGRALGLKVLATSETGFLGNIMHPDPDDRGPKLTLGQVYRIHVPLGTSLPGCDPGPCPALEAVVDP